MLPLELTRDIRRRELDDKFLSSRLRGRRVPNSNSYIVAIGGFTVQYERQQETRQRLSLKKNAKVYSLKEWEGEERVVAWELEGVRVLYAYTLDTFVNQSRTGPDLFQQIDGQLGSLRARTKLGQDDCQIAVVDVIGPLNRLVCNLRITLDQATEDISQIGTPKVERLG
jgi:hypothetical protein